MVVVGDVNVGKTRLICSRGYRKIFSFDELPNVAHASSVWAIDQVFLYELFIKFNNSFAANISINEKDDLLFLVLFPANYQLYLFKCAPLIGWK